MTDTRDLQGLRSKAVKWFDNKDIKDGVMLLHEAGASSFAISIAKINPGANLTFIENFLCYKLGITPRPDVFKSGAKSFRDEFPFLNSSNCPMELEALVTRKFARYHAYVDYHSKLRDCTSLREAADISRALIESYLENRAIWNELNWYQQHHAVLGRHPIFAEFARRRGLKTMSVKDLMIRKGQLKMNIWRIKHEIKKGNKPHLLQERKAKLDGYISEMEDINRLLG